MSKRQTLIIFGLGIIAFLFLGFPSWLDKILAIIAGIVVIGIAYAQKPEAPRASRSRVPYAEHRNRPVPAEPVENPISTRSADPIISDTPRFEHE